MVNKNNVTPLVSMIFANSTQGAKTLLDAGAKTDIIIPNSNDTPFTLAIRHGVKNKNIQIFDFQYIIKNNSTFSEPKKYIYEPNSAILKSGGFHEISHQLNIEKLHQHSHLYTSENLIEFPGRTFILENICNYNKKEIKKYLKENKANITTRNFPETVAQIRKKTKIKDGGSQYLFFTTLKDDNLKVLICSQVF